MLQLSLIQDNQIKKTIVNVPINELHLSKYNPRYSRDDEAVNRLAQRISRNGFEITRAVWATKNGNGYEVFAGGTRLEAAKRAGCKSIPVVLHEGLTEDDIVRLAYEDNENDEYHEPVSDVEVWSNYADLEAQGWKQERIARAVNASQSKVSERLRLHRLPNKIKNFIRQGSLKEAHLIEITALSVDGYFSSWITSESAWAELANNSAKLPTKETRVQVAKFKEVITFAQECYSKLSPDWQPKFVDLLAESTARTKAQVQAAYNLIVKQQLKEARRKEEELARQQSEAEAERLRLEQERQHQEMVKQVLDCLEHVDGIQYLEALPDNSVDMIFTDPPYDEESVTLYGKLAEVASRKLKPGGNLIAYAGNYALPRIFESMTPYLRYWWTLCLDHNGQSARLQGKRLMVTWKPLIWFVKDRLGETEYILDKFKSQQPDKLAHEWQQDVSEAKYYIEHLTKPDDLVVDPFCGSGTTLIAALSLGRRCAGCEIDAERFKNGQERLYEFIINTR